MYKHEVPQPVTWLFLRVAQANIPHLKEESQSYLMTNNLIFFIQIAIFNHNLLQNASTKVPSYFGLKPSHFLEDNLATIPQMQL